jgi:hypothetical protein
MTNALTRPSIINIWITARVPNRFHRSQDVDQYSQLTNKPSTTETTKTKKHSTTSGGVFDTLNNITNIHTLNELYNRIIGSPSAHKSRRTILSPVPLAGLKSGLSSIRRTVRKLHSRVNRECSQQLQQGRAKMEPSLIEQ